MGLICAVLAADPNVRCQEQQEPPVSLIRSRDLMAHAEYLASDEFKGRLTGSVAQARAAKWISNRLAQFGLEPMGDFIEARRMFEQRYSFRLSRISSESAVQFGQSRLSSGYSVLSAAPGLVAFDGAVQFVGLGTTRGAQSIIGKGERFDGLLPVAVIRPFRGQLDRVPSIAQKFSMSLSVFRRLSNITRGLAERGAKAVVFAIVDDSHGLSDVLSFMAVSPGQDLLLQGPKEAKSLMRGVIQRAQKDQVIPTVVLSLAQSRQLMAQLGVDQVKLKKALLGEGEMPAAKTATSSKLRIDVLHDEKAMTSNVVALLRGTDPVLRDEAIIFVAHMDHVGQRMDGQVFNGADDNASGVAGLLKIAGAFAMADPKPRRSVVFLSVSGEENGLWGSSYYTAHPAWPLDKTVAVINMDRIGRTGPNAKRLAVTVTPSYEHKAFSSLSQQVATIAEQLGLQVESGDTWFAQSDHFPFSERGVPVVSFSDGENADYHQLTDDADKLDGEKMERIARLAFLTGWAVANAQERPRVLGRRDAWK